MKKIINSKTIPYIVIICSIVGLALRLWIMGDGMDAFGLYPSNPVGWALLWVLTGGLGAMILFACAPLKVAGSYEENYPRSLAGMLGSLVAGVSVAIAGVVQLKGDGFNPLGFLELLVGLGGVAAGAVLILLGVLRLQGKKPNFILHAFLCLFFAVRVFHHSRLWSNEPQIGMVILPFLASLTLMLSCYQRACFDVGLGKRRHSLLWSLLGTYLCILAVLSFEEILVYGGCALWLMTDLCSLRPIRQKKVTQKPQETPAPEQTQADTSPETMTMEQLENWLSNGEQN